MYFNLSNDCFFVRGKANGVIHNLSNGRVVELTAQETDSMERIHEGFECERENYLVILEEMKWGFFSEKRYFVDKVRLYSNYMLLRPDLRPPIMDCAFLQLTNACGCDYQKCEKLFCTPCKKLAGGSQILTLEQWKGIIGGLLEMGCNHFILTGGDVTSYEELPQLMTYITDHHGSYSLVINPYGDVRGLNEDVPLMVHLCGVNSAAQIIHDTARFNQVTLLIPDTISDEDKQRILNSKRKAMVINAAENKIERSSMNPCTIDKFYKRKDYDNCLAGRIYIDYQGNMVPCLQGYSHVIGNLLTEKLQILLKELMIKYWNKPVNHARCGGCEWYYSCPVCLFMTPDKICNYIVEQGEWKTEVIL